MTRSRPRFAVLLACLALLPLALGCTPGSKSQSADTPVVLWVQMDPDEKARFEANLAAYREQHPGETVDFLTMDTENLRQQFQTQAAAGTGPDLVFGPSDQVGPLSLVGIIRPLDVTLPAGFFDRFIPSSLDTLNGHLWQAPDQVGNHLMLLYTRARVPEAPATSADFLAVAKRLTRPGRGSDARYGFAMNLTEPYWLIPFFGGFGGWVMDDAGRPTLDSPAMVQALAFLRDLKESAGIMPRESDYQVAETLFKEGRAAMIINGPWSIAGYRSAGIDLGAAPIFRLPNGRWAQPMVASKGYSISTNVAAAKLPRVIALVDFLTSAPAQERDIAQLGFFPSHREAYADSALLDDPVLRGSRAAYERGRRMPVVPEMRVLWDAMRPNMQDVMNGAKSPAEAARDMQSRAEQQIMALKE